MSILELQKKGVSNFTLEDFLEISSLDYSIIKENADLIDWQIISRFAPVVSYPVEFIWDYVDQWDWYAISRHQPLTENFVIEFEKYLTLYLLPENEYIKRNRELMKRLNDKTK